MASKKASKSPSRAGAPTAARSSSKASTRTRAKNRQASTRAAEHPTAARQIAGPKAKSGPKRAVKANKLGKSPAKAKSPTNAKRVESPAKAKSLAKANKRVKSPAKTKNVARVRGAAAAKVGQPARTRQNAVAPVRAAAEATQGKHLEPVIDVGAPAPPFELPDQTGQLVSSETLAGRPYVLYFYPKDDTPGCTREACGFRDDLARFEQSRIRVLGVSPDTPESHAKFAEKYRLSFPLLSDEERDLAQAYGVWTLKKNYGREYMGINRSTFLVDAAGRVAKVWRSVKVDGHVAKVLQAAESVD